MALIHFRESGAAGRPIVFLHGFCDNHELWSDFIRPFAERFRVVTPDLPGFGNSALPERPFTIDRVADLLADWFRKSGLVRPIVVGHSLGGYVALSLMERHGENLSGLVLFHSTAYADSEERKKVRDKVIAFVGEHGVAPFIETFVPGLFADKNHIAIPGTRLRAGRTTKEALVGYAEAMRDRPDRSGILARAPFPVGIIAGAKDGLIPLEDLRRLEKSAANVTLFELPEAAHMGMFEAKNQAQAILSSYIERIWPIKGT